MALHRGYLSPVKFEPIERMEKDLALGDGRGVQLLKFQGALLFACPFSGAPSTE
jgi:hypothetical protein